VQMRTPYDMLGRVLAVNSMFTGSSGSLGEFRAGAVAAALGAVPSALIGGLGTIVVMLIWMWAFPQLRRRRQIDAGGRSGAVTATLRPIKVRSFRACPRPRRYSKAS